jgi:cytochrome c oxidase subunit 4
MSDEHAHGDAHHVNYTAIFGVLCICTLLSIAFDLAKSVLTREMLIVLVLGVATCKATFVLLYFMHIKFEGGWKYVLLAPTMVLACCVPFALAPDISFHYYKVIVAQSYVVPTEHGEGAHGEKHDKASHPVDAAKHIDHDHADAKPAAKDAKEKKH